MRWLYLLLNAVQAFILAFWTAIWVPIGMLAALVTLNRDAPLVIARRVWGPPLIRASLSKFEVEVAPGFDWTKPYVFVMNHQSMLDVLCAVVATPINLRFVAKHSLRWVPLFNLYLWASGTILIDRSSHTKAIQSLKRAGRRIRAGTSIIAFPEGTRSRDGRILPFKRGPFMLALEAGVPVVPMAIEGSRAVLPADSFRLRPGRIRMKIGAPIDTQSYGEERRDELLQAVREEIIRLNGKLGGAGAYPQAIAARGFEGAGAVSAPPS